MDQKFGLFDRLSLHGDTKRVLLLWEIAHLENILLWVSPLSLFSRLLKLEYKIWKCHLRPNQSHILWCADQCLFRVWDSRPEISISSQRSREWSFSSLSALQKRVLKGLWGFRVLFIHFFGDTFLISKIQMSKQPCPASPKWLYFIPESPFL